MSRSEITIDLGALRRNARDAAARLDGAELWAVVKADAYGHGAVDCAQAALDGGCDGALRRDRRRGADAARRAAGGADPRARPGGDRELAAAREARLELTRSGGEIPEGVPCT